MGNILRIFFQSSCDSSGSNHDLFIDIQSKQSTDALPDDEDQTAYNVVNGVLEHSSQMVNDLESYKGATEEIRDAISQPNNDYQQRQTWREVCKFVTVLKRLYEYSQEIENIVPQLLYPLCSGPRTPIEHCQSQQALIKQFAEVLHFTLIFDRLKEETVEMSMDTANRMSLFYASPTPMLKMLSNATTKFVAEVGVIILYDHVHPFGAFSKKSDIDVTGAIKVIKSNNLNNKQHLLDALRVMNCGLLNVYLYVICQLLSIKYYTLVANRLSFKQTCNLRRDLEIHTCNTDWQSKVNCCDSANQQDTPHKGSSSM
ncbi:uncharacterized protein TRIADDRAFT_57978 [Trichoplax adhaerens]|uniref:CYRIA/CYRIB Rac1 binding domain-containing protein n=1 Tax=Trichoplax adhaerens TaxID=10228 RepID=B3S2D0_TRIAD|nr:hypothetical protein TRIADDRAFT_57978 [Trichoplax adhaerens]EDV23396.1 hypothetical protein TRIADDRAFT_57978 [Trichoplax adhaerens]|eukprot:XP_002114306.1 hypothetical protein TRIADDRAFT_57978 [Trichoplax adhaerens]